MPSDESAINLTHHFLIAMPQMGDETFARSVVYLCEHSARGALGLVVLVEPVGVHEPRGVVLRVRDDRGEDDDGRDGDERDRLPFRPGGHEQRKRIRELVLDPLSDEERAQLGAILTKLLPGVTAARH